MVDARRALLEDAVEKMSAGTAEFAVEVRGGDYGAKWLNEVDRRLLDYVTKGLDELGLVILGVDQANPDSVWIRVRNPRGARIVANTEGESRATAFDQAGEPEETSHLWMKDWRKLPLEMAVSQAEQILSDARSGDEEFVTFPMKDGAANTQFVADVGAIGAGFAYQLQPDS
jgi:hypothetical protein